MSVDYQPWYVGQTYPSGHLPLLAGGVADNISTVDITKFTMTFHPATGSDFTGTGTFTKDILDNSKVYYKFSPQDVASSFNGTLYISAFFPPSNTNVDEAVWDGIPFVISPK